jgi:hypothetical protein
MAEVRQTDLFKEWFAGLRDADAKRRIAQRIVRSLLGDVKPVGDGVSELRVDYGPGYRVVDQFEQGTGRSLGRRGRQPYCLRAPYCQIRCRSAAGVSLYSEGECIS